MCVCVCVRLPVCVADAKLVDDFVVMSVPVPDPSSLVLAKSVHDQFSFRPFLDEGLELCGWQPFDAPHANDYRVVAWQTGTGQRIECCLACTFRLSSNR